MQLLGCGAFFIDVEGEYTNLTKMLGGKVIKIEQGKSAGVNPFEIEPDTKGNMQFINILDKVAEIRALLGTICRNYGRIKMREVVLDTETTGLDPYSGHKLVSIGCVELENHVPTGKTYYQLINPERDVPEEVVKVHGLTNEILDKEPPFRDIVDDFLAFIDFVRGKAAFSASIGAILPEMSERAEILFLTVSREYAVEAFDEANDHLAKAVAELKK